MTRLRLILVMLAAAGCSSQSIQEHAAASDRCDVNRSALYVLRTGRGTDTVDAERYNGSSWQVARAGARTSTGGPTGTFDGMPAQPLEDCSSQEVVCVELGL